MPELVLFFLILLLFSLCNLAVLAWQYNFTATTSLIGTLHIFSSYNFIQVQSSSESALAWTTARRGILF